MFYYAYLLILKPGKRAPASYILSFCYLLTVSYLVLLQIGQSSLRHYTCSDAVGVTKQTLELIIKVKQAKDSFNSIKISTIIRMAKFILKKE